MSNILNVSPKNSYLTTKQWNEVVEYVKNRKNVEKEIVTEEVVEEIIENQHSEAYEQMVVTTSVEEMYMALLTIMNEEPEKLYEITSDELQTLYNMATQMNEENPSDDYVDLIDTLQYLAGEYDLNDAEVLLPTGTILSSSGGTLASGEYYLNSNITLSNGITISNGSTVSIDLNGYVLEGNGKTSVIVNRGTLTIQDRNGSNIHNGVLIDESYTFTGETEPRQAPKAWWKYDEEGDITIYGGVITGGYSSSGGGINNSGTLNLNGGTIAGCLASRFGGGIYNIGSIVINGGNVMYNWSSIDVGGICNRNNGSIDLLDGRIDHNTCAGSGGGIDHNASTFIMSGGSVSNNRAMGRSQGIGSGGGIYMENGSFIITGGKIYNNYAYKRGGGIDIWRGGTFTISGNCEIIGNMAGYCGGGLSIAYGERLTGDQAVELNITDPQVKIQENTAPFGGGVSVVNGDLVITSGTVSCNIATINVGKYYNNISVTDTACGGAVYLENGNANIAGGTFDGNFSEGNGGCIYINNGDFTTTSSTFKNNTAENSGGAIYIIDGNVSVKSGTITNNISLDKGGAIAVTSGNLIIGTEECHNTSNSSTHIHPVIQENIASDGGGIYVDGGITTMWCGDIKHNLTHEKTVNALVVSGGSFIYNGGTIGIPYDSGVFVEGGVFEDNTSEINEVIKHELHYHSVLDDVIHNSKIPESKWITSPRGDIFYKEDCDNSSPAWADLFPNYEFVGWENNPENDTDKVTCLYAIWERK